MGDAKAEIQSAPSKPTATALGVNIGVAGGAACPGEAASTAADGSGGAEGSAGSAMDGSAGTAARRAWPPMFCPGSSRKSRRPATDPDGRPGGNAAAAPWPGPRRRPRSRKAAADPQTAA